MPSTHSSSPGTLSSDVSSVPQLREQAPPHLTQLLTEVLDDQPWAPFPVNLPTSHGAGGGVHMLGGITGVPSAICTF